MLTKRSKSVAVVANQCWQYILRTGGVISAKSSHQLSQAITPDTVVMLRQNGLI